MKNRISSISLFICIVSACAQSLDAKISGYDEKSDLRYTFSGKYKPETFYGYNVNYFNKNDEDDKLFYARHILDLDGELEKNQNIKVKGTLRNRANWGNTNANGATTESSIRLDDSTFGAHRHIDTRLKITLRELWMSFNLGKTLGLTMKNAHTFKLGLFPFKLGRGISLGEAYATGPVFLGFYSDAVIDQFAPGAEITGDFIPDKLTYDFYVSIIENLATSYAETSAKIQGNEIGKRLKPQRGFGVINFLTAARFFWTAFDNELGSLVIEPYMLYNNAPEQLIDFRGDANSKLATVGLGAEYKNDRCEFGFEYATNMGRQKVKGWDRNMIDIANVNAALTSVNTQVTAIDGTGAKIPKVPHDTSTQAGRDAQEIIDRQNNKDGTASESNNGELIGTIATGFAGMTPPIQLFNSKNRFENGYNNSYEGWMFICDAAVWALNKDLRFSAMAGVASGDDNPNVETIDGNYRGFIGLQEMYTGDRVSSAFLLGGAGKAKRFLSSPNLANVPLNKFAPSISGFTNIIFVGSSLKWEPLNRSRKFKVFPNILAYWQQHPSRKFDIAKQADIDVPASTYLGFEVNTFTDFYLTESLKFFVIWSAFFPGSHYKDIQGLPTNKDQAEALRIAVLNNTGCLEDKIPNISNDIAFTLNLGLEFKF
jgi:hypothetical protein